MKKIQLAAFLVLTGAGIYQPTAHAVFQASPGDLFIGFSSLSGNVSSAYVIDVGPESLYTTGNGSSFQLNTNYYGGAASLNTALTSLTANDSGDGGGLWYNTQDTLWGVSGGTTGANNTIYAGKFESTTGTQSSAIGAQTANNLVAYDLDENNNLSSFNTIGVYNSGTQAVTESASLTNGWVTYNPTSGSSFVIGTQGNLGYPNTNSGFDIDLYQMNAGATGVYEGTFVLSTTGQLNYNSATIVPEPSALAALAGGAGLLGLIRRRRAVVA